MCVGVGGLGGGGGGVVDAIIVCVSGEVGVGWEGHMHSCIGRPC